MSTVRYSRKELNEKFSEKQNAEIQRLLAKGTVPDDQLDLSDIPEITDWSNAVRHNQFYRPVKQQTSIRLDADVLAWFKSQGKGYQTRMNEILRDAMLKELKVEFVGESVAVKNAPGQDVLEKCHDLGKKIAEELIKRV